ncbi:olfactory receptor 8A1-like [Ambystoma mexicanum]|uniref:olfactory receptor 8A1-like n=1 Tax=Ambystoma mexicanum TaxID=8296 RepID=UPI0037E94012
MEPGNQTTVMVFMLLGLMRNNNGQVLLFIFFALVYLVTLIDSIGIVILCCTDPQLYMPMYFFISNLSFVDLCYSSTVAPTLLMGLLVDRNAISITGCAVQLFFFTTFCIAESILLTVMAFDRYTAICKPLHYTSVMTRRFCTQLVALPYVCGLLTGATYAFFTFRLSFCDSKIPHYFCDLFPFFKLSCVDTTLIEILVYTTITIFGSCNIMTLIVSYAYIIITILQIRSSTGRQKIFSTCSPHFASVILFYGTAFAVYLHPNTKDSVEADKVISVFYTVIVPMLNPLIYGLRSKDVKAAFWRTLKTHNVFINNKKERH